MGTPQHKDLTGDDAIHEGAIYVQSADPGAVGAKKMWLDTSAGVGNYVWKARNAGNVAWDLVSDFGAAITALDDLSDVDLTGAIAGDLLAFDGADWIPVTPPTIPADLDDLSDVDTTGQTTGDVLTYDGADWVPQAPPGGGGGTGGFAHSFLTMGG